MQADKSNRLETQAIHSLLISLALPTILSTVANGLYNIVDRIFVGQAVGPDGLAAIAIGFPLNLIFIGFGMMIGIGGNSRFSIYLGAKDYNEAERCIGNALSLFLLCAALFTALSLLFIDPLMRLFGASEQILPFAISYMRIIIAGSIFQMLSFGMNNFIRGQGNARFAMFALLTGTVCNIALDALFIFGFNWGLRGAALATVLSQCIASILVMQFLLRNKSMVSIKATNMILSWKVIKGILSIGISPFMLQTGSSLVMLSFNQQLKRYGGDLAISSIGILFCMMMFVLMFVVGLNISSQPIYGYNHGAKLKTRVIACQNLCFSYATLFCIIGFCCLQLYSVELVSLFAADDEELLHMASDALRKFSIAMPLIGFQMTCSNFFQSIGLSKQAIWLTVTRQILFLIPTIYLFPLFIGINGIWYAPAIAETLSLGLCVILFTKHRARYI